jgi:UDP-glucose 4-epimerase
VKGVLVTGATTPIGEALIRTLALDRGVKRVLAVAKDPPSRWYLDNPKVTYVRADLTRPRKVRELMFGPVAAVGVDTIVHAALHRSAIRGGGRVHQLNVESTRLMLRLAETHPTVKRFVYRSHAQVYHVGPEVPSVICEDEKLNLGPDTPQWVRDRVEADLMVCTRMGMSDLQIAVLRCAEMIAPNIGSQLWDYLQGTSVCLRPLGYDPMLNLLTVPDAVRAIMATIRSKSQGVFNIPGYDTLPLSAIVGNWGRTSLALPGAMLGPLYRLRAAALKTEFRYDMNRWLLHYSCIFDGKRAKAVLGYEPNHPVQWPPFETSPPMPVE